LALRVIVRDPFVRVSDDKSQPKDCNSHDRREAPVSGQPPPKQLS
jgi:hypothetical protein